MKAVIVTPQIPIAYECGGIGTYAWHFARLLREAGEEVHVIFTHVEQRPATDWLPSWEQVGITVASLQPYGTVLAIPNGCSWQTWIAELAAAAIPLDADVVYFADWGANGFHFVRSRRYKPQSRPEVVTVLHGSTKWSRQGEGCWAADREDLAQDFRESYVARYSDFVASPSSYMLDWARDNRWMLPPEERSQALGNPFLPDMTLSRIEVEPAHAFERLVFYGRLDKRKGIDLFIGALGALRGKPCMQSIKEIVLLGGRGYNVYKEPDDLVRLLQTAVGEGITVEARTTLTSCEAQAYLAANGATTLVVVPSRSENLSYTIIEASLIPGLNLIYSNAGGIPEVLGPRGQMQMFAPDLKHLTNTVQEWLLSGPHDTSQMGHYDWQAANQRWLAFHEQVCDHARTLQQTQAQQIPTTAVTATTPGTKKSVDVCITYYNLGAYFPYLLESLAQQTTQDFNVIIINDGSTEAASIAVFEQVRQQYERENWQFVSTGNQGLSAARNLAVSLGSAEYLCFMDADNIAAPSMIERFIAAIRHSGDDCLTCYMEVFEGEGRHCTANSLLKPLPSRFISVGNYLALGVIDNPFGDVNCIIRRSVFEALDGFTTDLSPLITSEDRELFTRLSMAGYTLDVIPDLLYSYRYRKDSMLRTSDPFLNDSRVIRHYEEKLRPLGLEDLAALAVGARYHIEELQQTQIAHVAAWHELKVWIDHQQSVIEEQQAQLNTWHELKAWTDHQQARIAELEAAMTTMSSKFHANYVRSLRQRLLPIGSQRYEVYKGLRQNMRWLRPSRPKTA
ncbi:MAG: glycosyltransferase [Chloroflexota bacterium]|nr:glycosyltransferase [Chloroflexota bacterium]